MLLTIPMHEFKERQNKFFEKMDEKNVDAAVLFAVTDIFYLTGFHFHPTERPIGLFVDPDKKVHIFLPQLEHEHAEEYSVVDHVHSYPEYPGIKHPMEYFKQLLKEYGVEGKTVGYDAIGYGSSQGYRGPSVDKLIDVKEFVSLAGVIEEFRFVKSDSEIELIKESCRWGNLAHRLLQKYTKEGLSEIEITSKASMEATMAMIETLGPDYKPHGQTAYAIFRGQIGPESAFPHAVTQNAILQKGDTLVTGAAADVFGYKSELERTMFVGEYTKDQEKYFNYMYEAQDVAFDAIKAGTSYASVEQQVQNYFKEQGITELTRHHTGHNIGLLGHEAPFFDLGDDTEIKAGMVVTVEPGIYVPGLGGFRHSDTVLVTEDGIEMLTYYPRDLASLIC
ncbi:Xaa-Pro peptidase family protein [Planococcus liqunii]|uniref:Xaa-Pro peptidase family protein n=1 Tax=Planococcus liqunii TaxID=3058394 RepID=A0ABT8MSZ9_9BACL|nr:MULTISPECIES: Xaa-Pro peptidase family protein [unclassified Planococcus (in: firmicutes)]MDN7227875.1 Xaa-Pro peptidase family protein [Planococcus sp. N064]WKA50729.1 Xaa-Pro peptidase family protein [Planococcus sp. N056]